MDALPTEALRTAFPRDPRCSHHRPDRSSASQLPPASASAWPVPRRKARRSASSSRRLREFDPPPSGILPSWLQFQGTPGRAEPSEARPGSPARRPLQLRIPRLQPREPGRAVQDFDRGPSGAGPVPEERGRPGTRWPRGPFGRRPARRPAVDRRGGPLRNGRHDLNGIRRSPPAGTSFRRGPWGCPWPWSRQGLATSGFPSQAPASTPPTSPSYTSNVGPAIEERHLLRDDPQRLDRLPDRDNGRRGWRAGRTSSRGRRTGSAVVDVSNPGPAAAGLAAGFTARILSSSQLGIPANKFLLSVVGGHRTRRTERSTSWRREDRTRDRTSLPPP